MLTKVEVIRKYAEELERIEVNGTSAGYLTYLGLLADFNREWLEAPISLDAHITVPSLPEGYRWATAEETDRWIHPAYFSRMVQVRRGGTDDDPQTRLAIREDY